jgi:hypothetical protein
MGEEKKEAVEEAVVVDPKVIETKIDKGETLSKEEEQWMMETQEAPGDYNKGKTDPVESVGKPAEKTDEKPAEKKVEKPAEKAEVDGAEDFFVKLERELVKPDGKEDLKDFSVREKAYFHSMKRDRKERQKAETERDVAKFELSKVKKPVEKKEEEEVDPLADLDKKDPTDFMTVAEVKKLMQAVTKAPAKKEEEAKPTSIMAAPGAKRYLEMCDKEARGAHEDYEKVLTLAPEIIEGNTGYQAQLADALMKGENPAETMYSLIKNDPEFEKLLPIAEARAKAKGAQNLEKKEKKEEPPKPVKTDADLAKEKDAEAAQEALEKNSNKRKTTGHQDSSDTFEGTDRTAEEIQKMTDLEFARLPKKTRQKYLELYG